MPYNPALKLLPALDGPRRDSLFHCIDRERELHADHSVYVLCPPEGGEGCVPGYLFF